MPSPVEIPKKIKIGYRDYKVDYPYTFTEQSSSVGQHCATLCEIKITGTWLNVTVPDQAVIQTLMHEILHGIEAISNLGLFRDNDGNLDEHQVDGLAEWLCMVLRDNPDFVKLFLPSTDNS